MPKKTTRRSPWPPLALSVCAGAAAIMAASYGHRVRRDGRPRPLWLLPLLDLTKTLGTQMAGSGAEALGSAILRPRS